MSADPFIIDGPCLWSFSGGRTSAYMLWRALQAYGGKLPDDHVVVFANTGQEHEETLKFVDRVGSAFGTPIVWVEAVTRHNQRASSGHRIVSFETASRDGEPFEQMIRKYGIPNKAFPHCNRELKVNAISSFLRAEMGWSAGAYRTSIGIRADEADRATGADRGMVYPLVKAFVTKADIFSFWRGQAFDLYIPEHLGNCVGCWKKSPRKLLTLAVDHPSAFDFARRMEAEYGTVGAEFTKPDAALPDGYRRTFFRGSQSVADIFADAGKPFEKFVDGREAFDPDLDASGGACGEESCEISEAEDLFTLQKREAA